MCDSSRPSAKVVAASAAWAPLTGALNSSVELSRGHVYPQFLSVELLAVGAESDARDADGPNVEAAPMRPGHLSLIVNREHSSPLDHLSFEVNNQHPRTRSGW